MARKKKSLDDALADLVRLRSETDRGVLVASLRAALSDRSSHIVAKAATLAGEMEVRELEADLTEAFDRLMEDPAKRDAGCSAKAAIALALDRINALCDQLFLRGLRHHQMEPAWGGSVDTAVDLRSTCAFALTRIQPPDLLDELADLLADQEAPARAAAARAIAASGRQGASAMLRLALRHGDDDGQVITDLLLGLLAANPETGIELAREQLHSAKAVNAEAAALALGQSRHPKALDLLIAWYHRLILPGMHRTALLAIAMVRQDAARQFVIERIATESIATASEAMNAMSIHRHDPRVVEEVAAAVKVRSDRRLSEEFRQLFGRDVGAS